MTALAVMLGVAAGVSGFTFYYGQGHSYMVDDPAACKNCHIMREHYDAWARTSHHTSATCNDCHTPKDLVGKYTVKAVNGYNHSVAFTSGAFREPLIIKGFNKKIVQNNCIRCHQDQVSRMGSNAKNDNADCLHCHSHVGHHRRK